MKKCYLLLLLLFILFASAGCVYKGYTGEHRDLFTVGVNSVLWNEGYSSSADLKINPDIEILEQDQYGRTLFIYHEAFYVGPDDGNKSIASLIICQSSNEKEVYYYEDVNLIMKMQDWIWPENYNFSDADILKLKELNDWDKDLDLNKCVKKEIIQKKLETPYKKQVSNKIVEEYNASRNSYFLTYDKNNKNFIVYGCGFFGIVKCENGTVVDVKIVFPDDICNCIDELVELKKSNGWYDNI